MKILESFRALTKFEWFLWVGSLLTMIISFVVGGNTGWMTLLASLIGATALIFVSKGDVFGQILTVVFSFFYAVISFELRYYGEMITYLGMTSPIAILSVAAWMKHPYKEAKAEVEVGRLTGKKVGWMLLLTAVVTFSFYFVLDAFGTANLIVSTISIATSFLASFLMLLRSPAYAIAYAANDIVLIALWLPACIEDMTYLPMVVCFTIFLLNDSYGFFNWQRIRKRQFEDEIEAAASKF